ncbi:MAG: hypothetical protein GKR94_05480 [Gammaproteobacteria bacterium]|nr:hypothetical protein [Gammaproteobacteria bacterium]
MLTQRSANMVFSILVLLAAGFFAYLAREFQETGLLATSGLTSKFFPLTILTFIAVCALIVFIQYALADPARGDEKAAHETAAQETVFGNWREALRGIAAFAAAVACYLIWIHWGFVPMALTTGPACAAVMGVRSLPIYLFLIAAGYVIYLVFSRLLDVQLT